MREEGRAIIREDHTVPQFWPAGLRGLKDSAAIVAAKCRRDVHSVSFRLILRTWISWVLNLVAQGVISATYSMNVQTHRRREPLPLFSKEVSGGTGGNSYFVSLSNLMNDLLYSYYYYHHKLAAYHTPEIRNKEVLIKHYFFIRR